MVVSTALSKGSISLKANRFFMTGGHNDLSLSLCAIRGYYYSIRPGMGQILLNRKFRHPLSGEQSTNLQLSE
jgi:eukaryotic translation initiation factor 2C